MILKIQSEIIEINGELTQLELDVEIKDEVTIKIVKDKKGNIELINE